ncbi:hypothetical protein Lste_2224 [Legionella steelei]|uniref:Uncharacterized protein n=1 Tax=Legionella steelei TaxID=947033 RepID=A0A0W0ZJ66_9GAMM|nr:hypothetical protein [Legionella steelei]KTD69066.1 hypothetical protein Lste_2224 [Legionella steelei]
MSFSKKSFQKKEEIVGKGKQAIDKAEQVKGVMPTIQQLVFEENMIKERYGNLSDEDKLLHAGQIASQGSEFVLKSAMALIAVVDVKNAIIKHESANKFLGDVIGHEAMMAASLALVSETGLYLKDLKKQRMQERKFQEIDDVIFALQDELTIVKHAVYTNLNNIELSLKDQNSWYDDCLSLCDINRNPESIQSLHYIKRGDKLLKKGQISEVERVLKKKSLQQLITEQSIARMNTKERTLSLADVYQAEIESRIARISNDEIKNQMKQIVIAEQQIENLKVMKPVINKLAVGNSLKGILLSLVFITAVTILASGFLVAPFLPIAVGIVGALITVTATILAMTRRKMERLSLKLENNISASEEVVEQVFLGLLNDDLNNNFSLLVTEIEDAFDLDSLFVPEDSPINTLKEILDKEFVDPIDDEVTDSDQTFGYLEAQQKTNSLSQDKKQHHSAKVCTYAKSMYQLLSSDKFQNLTSVEKLAKMQQLNLELLKQGKKWDQFSLRQHWLFQAVDKLNTAEPKKWGKILSQVEADRKKLNTQHYWARDKPPILNFVSSFVNNIDDVFSHQAYLKTYQKYSSAEKAAAFAEVSTIFTGVLANGAAIVSTGANVINFVGTTLEAGKSISDIGGAIGGIVSQTCPFIAFAGVCMATVAGFKELRKFVAKNVELNKLDQIKNKLENQFNDFLNNADISDPVYQWLKSILDDDFSKKIEIPDERDAKDHYAFLFKNTVKATRKNIEDLGAQVASDLLGEEKTYSELIYEQTYARFHEKAKLLPTARVYQMAIEKKIESALSDLPDDDKGNYRVAISQAIAFKQHMIAYEMYQPMLKETNNARLIQVFGAFTIAAASAAVLAITIACSFPLAIAAAPILPTIAIGIVIGSVIAGILLKIHKKNIEKQAVKIETAQKPFKDSIVEFFNKTNEEEYSLQDLFNIELQVPFGSDSKIERLTTKLTQVVENYLDSRPKENRSSEDFASYLEPILTQLHDKRIDPQQKLYLIQRAHADYKQSLSKIKKVGGGSSLSIFLKSLDMDNLDAALLKVDEYLKKTTLGKGKEVFQKNNVNKLVDNITHTPVTLPMTKVLQEIIANPGFSKLCAEDQLEALFSSYAKLEGIPTGDPLTKRAQLREFIERFSKNSQLSNDEPDPIIEEYDDFIEYDTHQALSAATAFGL